MQLAIHHRPAPLCVGNIEQVRIGAAREAGTQGFTHRGTGSVTPGEVIRLAYLLAPVRSSQASQHASSIVFEAEELGLALDGHALGGQVVNQKVLVLVLWEDQHVGERAHTLADLAKVDARNLLAPGPKVRDGKLQPSFDHFLAEPELVVELERARLHAQGSRRGSRPCSLVDDAHVHAEPSKPEG